MRCRPIVLSLLLVAGCCGGPPGAAQLQESLGTTVKAEVADGPNWLFTIADTNVAKDPQAAAMDGYDLARWIYRRCGRAAGVRQIGITYAIPASVTAGAARADLGRVFVYSADTLFAGY